MADIFISYKHENRGSARAIAEMFTRHGFNVWWDIELLPGQKFAAEINSVINTAKAVVVLWTPDAINSYWVKSEAAIAMERGILIPAWLEKIDLPAPYNTLHTIDLSSWDNSPDDPVLEGLLAGVNKLLGESVREKKVLSREDVKVALEKPAHEVEFWSAVSGRSPQSADEYKAYLDRYGDNASFSKLAEIRIAKLLEPDPEKKRLSTRVKTNPVLASLIFLGIILIGLSLFTDTAKNLFSLGKGETRAEINGEWEAEVIYAWDNTTYTELFSFDGGGNELYGTASFLEIKRAILDGSVEKDRFEFVVKTQELTGQKVYTHHYRGKVLQDQIKFIMQTTGDYSENQPIEFTAERVRSR